jgi:hypothetical protein
MKSILIIFTMLAMLCPGTPASGKKADDSVAIQMLQSKKKAKTLEGATLKLAKPVLKKTPMSVFMDNIDAMLICPLEKSDKVSLDNVDKMLCGYTKVNEINDDDYRMLIYIDTLHGNRFTEIILYTTDPDKTIMVFCGDFTTEGLKKVGELSDQQREKRRQSRK